MATNKNQQSDADLSKFFEEKEKQREEMPSEPSKKKGLLKVFQWWKEMEEQTKLYIYLAIIVISLTLTAVLLRSFFARRVVPGTAPEPGFGTTPPAEEYIPAQ